MSVVIAVPWISFWGSGKTLVGFPKFVFLRCLVSLQFRADGVDILVIEVL